MGILPKPLTCCIFARKILEQRFWRVVRTSAASVVHGRPVRSLATNREPAGGGQRGVSRSFTHDTALRPGTASSGALEGQSHVGQQMFDRAEEVCDRMSINCRSKIVRRHMQVDLGARDQAMAEQIADRDEANALTHEMAGEGMP